MEGEGGEGKHSEALAQRLLGLSKAEPQHPLVSSGLRNKALAQAVPQPRLPTPCRTPGSHFPFPFCSPGPRQPRSLNAPQSHGRRARWGPTASIMQAGEGRLGLLSFLNFCAGQREPLSPGLPGLLPRPVAQVSHAVQSSSRLSPFVCGITEPWPLLPSLTPPGPLWASVSDHCFSEMNLNERETWRDQRQLCGSFGVLLLLAPHSSPVAKSGPQPWGWGPGALPGFVPGSFGDFP